jgi:Zn-dependent M28 family amino/carboxypeptidase
MTEHDQFTISTRYPHKPGAVPGGTSLAEEIVLIGAHYNTVSSSPGANDSTSGVAALLEIARLPDRIDHEHLARVVEGLAKVTVDLAQQR